MKVIPNPNPPPQPVHYVYACNALPMAIYTEGVDFDYGDEWLHFYSTSTGSPTVYLVTDFLDATSLSTLDKLIYGVS